MNETPTYTSPPAMIDEVAVLWDVVEEHLDEAEFLLGRWCSSLQSPRLTRADLTRATESRLLAHLDGLVVGGAPVAERLLWPLCSPEGEGPPIRRAAAALALLQADPLAAERLVGTFVAAPAGELRAGLARAFQLCEGTQVDEPLRLALYATDRPDTQAALLQLMGARGLDPGPIESALLASEDASLLQAALRACAGGSAATLQPAVLAHLSHPDLAVRMAAIETSVLWNLRLGWQAALVQAQAGVAEALLLVGLIGGPAETSLLTAHLATPERRRAALWALGFLGTAEAAEACLPFVADAEPRTAAAAIEALVAITGLPFRDPPFIAPAKPEPAELPPLEEDLEVDLTPDPLDELPPPNAAAIADWWHEHKAAFTAGKRHCDGHPISAATFQTALDTSSLRRLLPLRQELAIRSAGRAGDARAPRLAFPRVVVPHDVPLDRPPRWH